MRTIDLAVNAGKKRQSSRTGFVHYFPGCESGADTIPIFENFCFALALFRQKSTESVLEGKEIIERLLAFQTEEGNFPVYLHDFPKCWDFHQGLKIAPIIIHILRDFGSVLNSAYKEKLESALKKMVQPPKSTSWEPRYRACLGERPPLPALDTSQEWFEWIISDQLFEKGGSYPIPFDRNLGAFIGNHPNQDLSEPHQNSQNIIGSSISQEKGEPQPLPIEYILAEKNGFDKRLLRDHLNQLYSALLYPFTSSKETSLAICQLNDPAGFLWKGETLHSLVIPKGEKNGNCFIFELPDCVDVGRDDLFEVLVFCDISPETSLYINDQKGMVFYVDDTLSIRTPHLNVGLRFEILKGEGEFCGHISRANRPNQISCHGSNQYEAYDWQIGLRTLRRKGSCTIGCFVTFF